MDGNTKKYYPVFTIEVTDRRSNPPKGWRCFRAIREFEAVRDALLARKHSVPALFFPKHLLPSENGPNPSLSKEKERENDSVIVSCLNAWLNQLTANEAIARSQELTTFLSDSASSSALSAVLSTNPLNAAHLHATSSASVTSNSVVISPPPVISGTIGRINDQLSALTLESFSPPDNRTTASHLTAAANSSHAQSPPLSPFEATGTNSAPLSNNPSPPISPDVSPPVTFTKEDLGLLKPVTQPSPSKPIAVQPSKHFSHHSNAATNIDLKEKAPRLKDFTLLKVIGKGSFGKGISRLMPPQARRCNAEFAFDLLSVCGISNAREED